MAIVREGTFGILHRTLHVRISGSLVWSGHVFITRQMSLLILLDPFLSMLNLVVRDYVAELKLAFCLFPTAGSINLDYKF